MFNELLVNQLLESNVFPSVILIALILLFALYAMVHGTTVNASAEVEGKSTIWGILLTIFGVFMLLLSIFFSLFIILGGGEGMIPESAWPLLTGALTLMGTGFAAALAIMVAAKAGAEMLTQKPELSIWSLLFVALGEGLAIYGLIIAILMISKGG